MSHVQFLLESCAASVNAVPDGYARNSHDWRLADNYLNEAYLAHQDGDDQTAKALLRKAAPILRQIHAELRGQ